MARHTCRTSVSPRASASRIPRRPARRSARARSSSRVQPPCVADDVYGFGALAYELLSGYPPHYPDAAAAAAGAELPATIPARVPVPAALTRLVLECLSRIAGRAAGRHGRAARGARPARSARTATLRTPRPSRALRFVRPPNAPAPIEPRWRRAGTARDDASGSGPTRPSARPRLDGVCGARRRRDPCDLRAAASGCNRRPSQRHPPRRTRPPRRRPAPRSRRRVSAISSALRSSSASTSSCCRRYAERLDALVARAAGEWGGEAFARARRTFDRAAQQFAARDYEPALAELKRVAADLTTTEKAADGALRDRARRRPRGAGKRRRRRRRAAVRARAQAEARSRAGYARSRARARLSTRCAGSWPRPRAWKVRVESDDAAALYRKALALDRDAAPAQQGLARIQSAQSGSAFGSRDVAGSRRPRGRQPGRGAVRHLNAQVGSAPAPPRCRTASRRWRARGAMQVSRRTSRRLSAPSGRSAGRRRSKPTGRRSRSTATCSRHRRALSAPSLARRSRRNSMATPHGLSDCSRPRCAPRRAARSRQRPFDRTAPGRCCAVRSTKVDSAGGVCGSASRRLPHLRQPDRRYDLPHRADWHVRSQGHGAAARALHDRRNAFRVPGRAARGDGAAGADAASGRDTVRGTDLSAQLIIREPLGERRLTDEALPMSIGGPGSDVIVPAPAAGAAGMDRRAGRAALSAAGIDRVQRAAQRRANRRLHVAA